jgi:hypothetical protein
MSIVGENLIVNRLCFCEGAVNCSPFWNERSTQLNVFLRDHSYFLPPTHPASGARHDTTVERRASDLGCFHSDYLGSRITITPLLTGGHGGWLLSVRLG